MPRNLYTEDEVVLCTYLALYGDQEFTELDIFEKYNRPLASIKMKVKNIAAMLDEEEITRFSNIPSLSGVTTGQTGRRTNWDWVARVHPLSQEQFLSRCVDILNSN